MTEPYCCDCGRGLGKYNVGKDCREVLCDRCTMALCVRPKAKQIAEKKDREADEKLSPRVRNRLKRSRKGR